MHSKIRITANNWYVLCNFYSKMIFFKYIFLKNKYLLLVFFAEFESITFHNNIVEVSEKNEQAELVENLPPSYLPYRFLHNLHSFPLRIKVNIWVFNNSNQKKKLFCVCV